MPTPTTTSTTVEVNGFALREIRVRSGIGVRELAEQVGCDRSYVALIETGRKRSLSPQMFNALLDALHIQDRRALLAAPSQPQEQVA